MLHATRTANRTRKNKSKQQSAYGHAHNPHAALSSHSTSSTPMSETCSSLNLLLFSLSVGEDVSNVVFFFLHLQSGAQLEDKNILACIAK